ncbi:MAG: hypothetical protein WCH99_08855 [Verrucomicrobiota bacterium]
MKTLIALISAVVVSVIASATLTPTIQPSDDAVLAMEISATSYLPRMEQVGKCDLIVGGQTISSNGIALPALTTYDGRACTNGVAAIWNSNGVVLIRFSNVGSTIWNEKQIAP